MSKKKLAVEIVWSELLLCGGEWRTRKAIYEELIAEGFERQYVDWYVFCLSNHQPEKESMKNTEQTFEDAVLAEMTSTLVDLHKMAETINRGPGGREVALAITNMQQARFWLNEAERIIAGSDNQ